MIHKGVRPGTPAHVRIEHGDAGDIHYCTKVGCRLDFSRKEATEQKGKPLRESNGNGTNLWTLLAPCFERYNIVNQTDLKSAC